MTIVSFGIEPDNHSSVHAGIVSSVVAVVKYFCEVSIVILAILK